VEKAMTEQLRKIRKLAKKHLKGFVMDGPTTKTITLVLKVERKRS
jgi:hypothetical protein